MLQWWNRRTKNGCTSNLETPPTFSMIHFLVVHNYDIFGNIWLVQAAILSYLETSIKIRYTRYLLSKCTIAATKKSHLEKIYNRTRRKLHFFRRRKKIALLQTDLTCNNIQSFVTVHSWSFLLLLVLFFVVISPLYFSRFLCRYLPVHLFLLLSPSLIFSLFWYLSFSQFS